MDTTQPLATGALIMGLFGGLAVFLYGMEQMTDALKVVAGARMKDLLARLTTNRFKAAFAGAFITAVIQSSSVTTVLVIGFISAGLMTLTQSVGVIMGANIGTTVTAQIIAFKVTHYALLLVALGFGLGFFGRRQHVRKYGAMVLGLGFVFLGMGIMSEATAPLRTYQPFVDLMAGMSNPLTGIAVATVFTALVQSSSATTGVVIVLASQGFITLESGIALAFGANVGTCITALLASLGKPREAIQAALIHVLFNLLGVLVWIGFIDHLAGIVRSISPTYGDLEATARLAAETPRQIANAHTIFNIANSLLFLGFAAPFARLATYLCPVQPEEDERSHPRFIKPELLDTPIMALNASRLELCRLAQWATEITDSSFAVVLEGDDLQLEEITNDDRQFDILHGHTVTYLGALSLRNLDQNQTHELHGFIAMANYLASIADMVDTNLVDSGRKRIRSGIKVSEGTKEILDGLHTRVTELLKQVGSVIAYHDLALAGQIEGAKEEVNDLAAKAGLHLAERLTIDEPNRASIYRLETEIIEYLKRVYYFTKRICKVIQEPVETPPDAAWSALDEVRE